MNSENRSDKQGRLTAKPGCTAGEPGSMVLLHDSTPADRHTVPNTHVPRTYDGLIHSLNDNQVFVFGTNPVGINGNPVKGTGGAALVALNNGWIKQREKLDNCLSMSGKAWGLTTVTYPGKKRSIAPDQIIVGVRKLYEYAQRHPHLEFLVAYTATAKKNLNGYTNDEMAQMFAAVPRPPNIVFERGFAALVSR